MVDGDDRRPTTQLGCSRLCWHGSEELAAAVTHQTSLADPRKRALVPGSVGVEYSTVIASLTRPHVLNMSTTRLATLLMG